MLLSLANKTPGHRQSFSIGSQRDQLLFSRSRVFYGWWIVAIAAVGLFFSEPTIAVYSYSVFLKAVSQDFRVGEPLLWSPLLWLSLWLWLFQLCPRGRSRHRHHGRGVRSHLLLLCP